MSSTTRDHNTEESVARALAVVEEERGDPSTTQDVFGDLDLRNAYNNLLSRNQELTHALYYSQTRRGIEEHGTDHQKEVDTKRQIQCEFCKHKD